MNVGDYVRTNCGIAKIRSFELKNKEIINLDKDIMICNMDIYRDCCTKSNVIKSSPQIIDLIEKGDYVNGSWVNEIIDGKPYHEDYNDPFYSYYFENDDIKTVVTHEQMEAMQYRVEE